MKKNRMTLKRAKSKGLTYGRTLLMTLVMILVSVLLTGCRGESTGAGAPNVILITIDTLRADHLSCYGYPRPTSPFMDQLAGRSFRFTHAYATSSWTGSSMASIFTGLPPSGHGVIHGEARGPRAAVMGQEILDKQFLTIPEALKKKGYTTFGVSSNGHVSGGTGFAQGFDHFITHWFMDSPLPNKTVKKWLDHIRNAPRYFLWVHYFDPHNPYAPRLPWYRSYLEARLYEQLRQHPGQTPVLSPWRREAMANPMDYIDDVRTAPDALETLIDRYDSEINFCDHQVKVLFDMLDPGPNTLVIITSDHGEAFLEHDQLLHGNTLYEEETRVPLLIRLPADGTADAPGAGVITGPVSNGDIFATIADVTGLEKELEKNGEKHRVPGTSLMPLMKNREKTKKTEETRPVFMELDWKARARALRVGQWKFLVNGNGDFLFDLAADPAEKTNLSAQHPEQAALFKGTLEKWMKANPPFKARRSQQPIDRERENKLRTLGYL